MEPDGVTVSFAKVAITSGPFNSGNITFVHIHAGSASVNGPPIFLMYSGNQPYTQVFPVALNNFVLNSTFVSSNLITVNLYLLILMFRNKISKIKACTSTFTPLVIPTVLFEARLCSPSPTLQILPRQAPAHPHPASLLSLATSSKLCNIYSYSCCSQQNKD